MYITRASITKPNSIVNIFQLADTLYKIHSIEKAERCFYAASTLDPQHIGPLFNLSVLYYDWGRQSISITLLRKIIFINPLYYAAYINLANILQLQFRHQEAYLCHLHAVALNPAHEYHQNNLSAYFQNIGDLEQALIACQRAVNIAPKHPALHSSLIFVLDLMPHASLVEQQQARRLWYQRHGAALTPKEPHFRNEPVPQKKLRLGFVSADFCGHSAGVAFEPVLQNLNPDEFSIYCYSGVRVGDQYTDRFKSYADAWIDAWTLTDEALTAQIQSDQIDILFDLSGHTIGHRLTVFSRRPAPVQVSAWGLATGTGLATMDALFSDPILIPFEDRHLFPERIIDLPSVITLAQPTIEKSISAFPRQAKDVVTFGSLNRMEKITTECLSVWAEILTRSKNARLFLKNKSLDDAKEQARILRTFQNAGIQSDRLILRGKSSRSEHYGCYEQIDVTLDTFPANGGVTTLESLWMGTPVIVMTGGTPASRMGTSICTSAGLHDCIATSPEHYIETALTLIRNQARLEALRRELPLTMQNSALGNGKIYTKHVEDACRILWHEWCSQNKTIAQHPSS